LTLETNSYLYTSDPLTFTEESSVSYILLVVHRVVVMVSHYLETCKYYEYTTTKHHLYVLKLHWPYESSSYSVCMFIDYTINMQRLSTILAYHIQKHT